MSPFPGQPQRNPPRIELIPRVRRNDAFTAVSISQSSLAYEKASVIFNIGSTLSSLSSASPRSPESLKRTFNSLRQAQGMFIYINDNFLHAPSTDLSREVVKVLVTLMEAQGTEIFLENMAQVGENGKGAALRAKVSITASSLYSGIVEECKEWVTKDVFIKEWSLLVQVCLVLPPPRAILTTA